MIGNELGTRALVHKAARIPVAINPLVKEALTAKSAQLDDCGILTETRFAHNLPPILGDPQELRDTFVALLSHFESVLEIKSPRHLLLRTRTVRVFTLTDKQPDSSRSGLAFVEIHIQANRQRTADTPYSNTAPKVSVLELAIPSKTIEEHGGYLKVGREDEGGPVLLVRLPVAPLSAHYRPNSVHVAQHITRNTVVDRATAAVDRVGGRSLIERRSSTRVNDAIQTLLVFNVETWQGIAPNISLGGLYIVVPTDAPAYENQVVRLGLVSEVGILELQGRVCAPREIANHYLGTAGGPAKGLPIEFQSLTANDKMVLESLLNGVRERAVTIKLRAILMPQEPGDLLLEVSSAGLQPFQQSALAVDGSDAEESVRPDRRLEVREDVSIKTFVYVVSDAARTQRFPATTINLSMGGACVEIPAQDSLQGSRVLLGLALSETSEEPFATDSGEEHCQPVEAEIVWNAQETLSRADLHTPRVG